MSVYWALLIFLGVHFALYCCFRSNITNPYKKTKSYKQALRKRNPRKLFSLPAHWLDYLWFASLGARFPSLSKVLLLNQVYTCLFFPTALLHLLLGWLAPFQWAIFSLHIPLAILGFMVSLASTLAYNRHYHKCSIVWWRKDFYRHIDSFVFDLLLASISLFFLYIHWILLQ